MGLIARQTHKAFEGEGREKLQITKFISTFTIILLHGSMYQAYLNIQNRQEWWYAYFCVSISALILPETR